MRVFAYACAGVVIGALTASVLPWITPVIAAAIIPMSTAALIAAHGVSVRSVMCALTAVAVRAFLLGESAFTAIVFLVAAGVALSQWRARADLMPARTGTVYGIATSFALLGAYVAHAGLPAFSRIVAYMLTTSVLTAIAALAGTHTRRFEAFYAHARTR